MGRHRPALRRRPGRRGGRRQTDRSDLAASRRPRTVVTHPRGDATLAPVGVFSLRSEDRPNPIGLHRVTVVEIAGSSLRVEPLEAVDGTPVIDLKPVIDADDR